MKKESCFNTKRWFKGDQVFLFYFFILVIFGLFVLTSASFFVACSRFNDCYFYLKHQLVAGFLPGLFLFSFFSFFDYHRFKKISLPLLLLSVVFLIFLYIPGWGVSHGFSVQWLNLGFLSFQPSELVKLFLIIYFSCWLAKKDKDIKSFSKVFAPLIIFLGIIEILIVKQPDFGAAIIVFILFLALYFIAGGSWLYLISLLFGGFVVSSLLIFFSPYHLARIKTFLYPGLDPAAAGYQINQALLAIGSGGIFGRGLGRSIQKFAYLPEMIGDSIFAILAEDLGFIVTVLIIALYVCLFLRIFKIAKNSPDKFGYLLAFGIGFWFILQVLINIAAMLNIIPLTGITLPFLSYGGTSFCVFSVAFGIVYNISCQASPNKAI